MLTVQQQVRELAEIVDELARLAANGGDTPVYAGHLYRRSQRLLAVVTTSTETPAAQVPA